MKMKDWVKLPTAWIQEGGLKKFHWKDGEGADHIAALMVLVTLAHHADDEDGIGIATYETLQRATGLSRAKISAGLAALDGKGLIVRRPNGRSSFELVAYNPNANWGKLPARKLYSGDQIVAFQQFHLRLRTELDALKLYLLIVARRGSDTNMANISYDKINEYSDIPINRIKAAVSFLAANGLVHVEHVPSLVSNFGISNGYRLAFIDSHHHMGTTGRGKTAQDFLS